MVGGFIDEMPPAPPPSPPVWLVYDAGAVVQADMFGLFSAGDGVHDPVRLCKP